MSHPSYGTPRPPDGPGQYPAPGPYPYAPGPRQMPPGPPYPSAGPGGGYGPPGPSHPPMPPGNPYPVAPKKSRKGVWFFTLMAVLALGSVLACGGCFGYFGWLQPKQERDHHTRIFESLGVPEGFTVTEPRFTDETLHVTYYLLCEKRICPVNPAEKIHKWVTDNKMTDMTLQDVQKCLADAFDDRDREMCILEWKVDGKVVSAQALWTTSEGEAEDRRWILNTEIYKPAN